MSTHQHRHASPSSTPQGSVLRSGPVGPTARGDNSVRQAMLNARVGMVPEVLGQAFGADFGGVQVQVDGVAGQAGANALAQGGAIHVDPAHYRPGTPGWADLLGEELSHLVQQSNGQVPAGAGVVDSPALEGSAKADGRRVAQGQPAQTQAAGRAPRGQGPAQANSDLTAEQITAAQAWSSSADLGREGIEALQRALGVAVSGTYDEATIRAVYGRQREWQPTGPIREAGQASRTVFRRLGLIFTNTIQNAGVGAGILGQLETNCPEGITVAIVPEFVAGVSGRAEFASQARTFARNQVAVGLQDGQLALGVPVIITELGDAIEAVQSISRGLQEAWQAEQNQSAEAPAYTRVKNLALFSHGESWGMGLNANNDFSRDGLHNTTRGNNPSNVDAFAQGLQGALAGGVRVQLFACSTGADADRTSYQEWTGHAEGERHAEDSLAASLAGSLGSDASVYAHSTVGHTTENYAARVFGAEAGGGQGGLHLFDSMYPAPFIQSELVRLFPDLSDADRTARRSSLREQMWAHYKDSIVTEHQRPASQKRYSVPMGQECFTNPSNARDLLHTDWETWIESRRAQIQPQ